ncbi:MAG: hypothetical protein HQL17_03185 [Candidatus Omnitrophica bacterium]|nr:hypothetical protein [Candidatus Omnitrophota bacterium]
MKKVLLTLIVLGMFTGISFAQAPADSVTANTIVNADKAPEQGVKKAKKWKMKKQHKASKRADKKADKKAAKKEAKDEAVK